MLLNITNSGGTHSVNEIGKVWLDYISADAGDKNEDELKMTLRNAYTIINNIINDYPFSYLKMSNIETVGYLDKPQYLIFFMS